MSRGRLLAKATELQEPSTNAYRGAAALILLARGRRDVQDLLNAGIEFCETYLRDLEAATEPQRIGPEFYDVQEVFAEGQSMSVEEIKKRRAVAHELREYLFRWQRHLKENTSPQSSITKQAPRYAGRLRELGDQYQTHAGMALGEYAYGPRVPVS